MMQPDVVLRRGDRLPTLSRTITLDGEPLDLTGYTVTFTAVRLDTGAPVMSGAATIADPTAGVVTYAFTDTDAATPGGTYAARFEATAGATRLTVPNDGFLVVRVIGDLDAMWSYSGDPSLRPLDGVRFLLSDTTMTDPKITDAEILWALTEAGGDLRQAAATAADAIAAAATAQANISSKSVGDLSITYAHQQRAQAYAALADRLRAQASRRAAPRAFAGGITTPPVFSIGMTDSTPSSASASPTSSPSWG